MSLHPDYLTATDFYQLFKCPHWPYFERFADDEEKKLKRDFTESEIKRMEDGVAHEARVVADFFKDEEVVKANVVHDAEKDFEATLDLMRQGVTYIYQGTLTFGDWTGRPDLLERQTGESELGAWHYIPLDVKSTFRLEKYQKFQLTFYSVLLEKIQKRFPAQAAIFNLDRERMSFQPADFLREFEETVVELERIRAGERPDPVLRKSCFDSGPWGAACERLAKMNDDIALLYNVDVKKLRVLRDLGVRTVADAAEMDPAVLDGTAPGLRAHGLERIKLQARALRDEQVYIRKPADLPAAGLEIHFDIESYPPDDKDYLYGFLIREKTGDRYQSFFSRSAEGEEGMWREFLAWIETLPENFTVYHFAVYEKTRLAILEKRYGGSAALEHFRENMVDLKEMINSCAIFPLYFYGLKYVASFLGFSWQGAVKGGSQSVDYYEKFLENGDESLLEAVVRYNEEDVRATAFLKDWLEKYAQEITSYEQHYPWQE
ncbi:TM0106 family RecB-like putative nuclease [Patescibacteria group bacterium]|nr:TM0106 family RecB-like putative nuclease [Patescibacteria group bacterium]MBU1908054.1 TM0106 family RecB-like putative nuclease [Patescibacteria group bacterium]